jgi:hypothetical protein
MKYQTTITVTLFGEDSCFDGRRHFRDLVDTALQQAQLGESVGGGSMVTDEPNYNIEYDVIDEGQGLTLIRDTLRSAGVGASTEISVGGSRRYNVYDDGWTDLGPRQPSPQSQSSATDSLADMSGGDFLDHLKKIADGARKKYDKP